MHITQKETAKLFDKGYGERIYSLAEADENFGNLKHHSMALAEIDPGKSNKKHYHPKVEETYYILAGEALITIDDETKTLHPGQLVTIPVGATHKITNPSKDTVLSFIVSCATPWTPDCSVFLE